MDSIDRLGFTDRQVVITGAASGVGKAVMELIIGLGGDVVALDVNPVDTAGATFIRCDLADKHSIDAALARIEGPVAALCNIAAVPSGAAFSNLDIVTINYLAHRRLTEGLLSRMLPGAAVVCVSSGAAMAYGQHVDALRPFVALADFEAARQWLRENPERNNGYPFSKEALNLWLKLATRRYAEEHGVRINAIAPGLIDTGMLRQSASGSREQLMAMFKSYLDRISQPVEQAWPVVFLASRAASYLTGQIIEVDGGLSTAAFHRDGADTV